MRKYTLPLMLADMTLFALAYPMVSKGNSVHGLIAWSSLYLAAGPTIHALHGNRAQIGRSLARRVVLPAAFALAAYKRYDECEAEDLCFIPALFGAGIGALVAAGYDWARGRVEIESPAPVVIVDRDRVVVGFGRRF